MNTEEAEVLTSLAREIGRRLRLAHHVPGRVRVKFDTSLAEHPHKETLKQWLPDEPPFRLQNVNPWSHSVVISYDPKIIPPQMIDELFTSHDEECKKDLLKKIKRLVG